MEEKKFVEFKKEELGVKEYIKRALGKGKISNVLIEYTPVGEKIIIATYKPGLVIGRKGEKIDELTRVLKKRFNLEMPQILFSELETLAVERGTTVVNLVRSFIRLGLFTVNAQAGGASLVLEREEKSERVILLDFLDGSQASQRLTDEQKQRSHT